tara:strand:- start:108 stop:632 length:525 start_codon:yes stop_codon:yes gene_type:complete
MSDMQFEAGGQLWTPQINGFTVKRCKSECDFNLFSAIEDIEATLKYFRDHVDVYIDCLWIACEEQAASRGIDEVGFAKLLLGGVLVSSVDAFVVALANFYQNDHLAKAVHLIVKTNNKAREAAMEQLGTTVNDLEMTLASQETSLPDPPTNGTNISSKLPERSAQIQTDEHCVN